MLNPHNPHTNSTRPLLWFLWCRGFTAAPVEMQSKRLCLLALGLSALLLLACVPGAEASPTRGLKQWSDSWSSWGTPWSGWGGGWGRRVSDPGASVGVVDGWLHSVCMLASDVDTPARADNCLLMPPAAATHPTPTHPTHFIPACSWKWMLGRFWHSLQARRNPMVLIRGQTSLQLGQLGRRLWQLDTLEIF